MHHCSSNAQYGPILTSYFSPRMAEFLCWITETDVFHY